MGRAAASTPPLRKKQKLRVDSIQPTIIRYPAVKFSGESQRSLYTTLSQRPVFPNKYTDMDAIDLLGIIPELKHKLAKVGWSDLLKMDDPSYATLTREFLSSFMVTEDGLLSFRIANQNHQITKDTLASMFGWKLIDTQPLPSDFATPFWLRITGLPATERYVAQNSATSKITSYCYRYFLRLLSYTIYGRAESNNRIQAGELALLYYFDAEIPVDWTTLLIARFLYQAKRPKGALVIGGFITRIATKLGVFDCKMTNLKVADEWASTLDVEYVIGMHMLHRHCKIGGINRVHPKRDVLHSEKHGADPVIPIERQIAELRQGQERIEKQLADISASLERYFSQHAS